MVAHIPPNENMAYKPIRFLLDICKCLMTGIGAIKMAKSVRTHEMGMARLRSRFLSQKIRGFGANRFEVGKQMKAPASIVAIQWQKTKPPRIQTVSRKPGMINRRCNKISSEILLNASGVECRKFIE